MSDLFLAAVLDKYRYTSVRGNVNTEDLVTHSLEELNEVAKGLNSQIKSIVEEDFIGESSSVPEDLLNRFEIVKTIISLKKKMAADKAEAARIAREKKAEKQELLGLIKEKKLRAKADLPLEELERLVESI